MAKEVLAVFPPNHCWSFIGFPFSRLAKTNGSVHGNQGSRVIETS